MPSISSAKAALLALLHQADGFDRSWSITATGQTEARALFYFEQRPGAAEALADAARLLGMAEPGVQRWRAGLPGADAIGLTVNAALSSVRLYLQYWDRQVERVAQGALGEFPLYRGIKALPDGSLREDGYLCTPLAPRDRFWPQMAAALTRFGAEAAALEQAFAPLTAETCIHTRTEAPGRSSWLSTVRRAPLVQADVARALMPIAAAAGLTDLAQMLPDQPLLHVAAGQDRVKGAFLTLYLEAGPDQVAAMLQSGP